MDMMKEILRYDWLPKQEKWIPPVLFKERNTGVFFFYIDAFKNNIQH